MLVARERWGKRYGRTLLGAHRSVLCLVEVPAARQATRVAFMLAVSAHGVANSRCYCERAYLLFGNAMTILLIIALVLFWARVFPTGTDQGGTMEVDVEGFARTVCMNL